MVKDHFRGASFNSCFAVFDGHGGQRAAEFARQRLPVMLEQHEGLETNVMGSISQGKSLLHQFRCLLKRLQCFSNEKVGLHRICEFC